MEKYFKTFAGIIATAFIISSCSPMTYAQNEGAYYNPNNGYNYGYGDGPDEYYDYNQPSANYNGQGYQHQQPVSFGDFYNQLLPYGVWINLAPYGQVWVANVPNFQPYSTNGYWAYTTYGWTWASNYDWGWAPFHYGRWGYNNRYGWYWVPGYVWGPAWVAWSNSADIYGWAPLMPGMHFGVSLSVNLFPSTYWTFMQGRYMGSPNIGGYYIDRSRNVTIIKNTTIINNYGTENNRRYSMGPNAADVQRYTGRSIQPMRVSNAADRRSAGISNNEMRVYRPITEPNVGSRRAAGASAGNNGSATPQTRRQSEQPANNGSATPQMRRQSEQPANNGSATPQMRRQSEQPANNEPANSQMRRQSEQPANSGSATPQTRRQPDQPANNRSATPQARPQSSQPETRQAAESRAAQTRVTNSAAPQTTKQIQTAQKESTRTQQRTTSTPARTR